MNNVSPLQLDFFISKKKERSVIEPGKDREAMLDNTQKDITVSKSKNHYYAPKF